MFLSVWICVALAFPSTRWLEPQECVCGGPSSLRRRYGFTLLTAENVRLGGGCVAWLMAAFLVSRQTSLLWPAAFLGASAAAAWTSGLVQRVTGWLELDRSAAA